MADRGEIKRQQKQEKQMCRNKCAIQTNEILHWAAACPIRSAPLYVMKVVPMPPLSYSIDVYCTLTTIRSPVPCHPAGAEVVVLGLVERAASEAAAQVCWLLSMPSFHRLVAPRPPLSAVRCLT